MRISKNQAAQLTGDFVKGKIIGLVKNVNEAAARATLAMLRRGIGKAPGAIPELWEMTLSELPSSIGGQGDDIITQGEWAAYTALTLFALHQQGNKIKEDCMSCEGETLGRVARRLIGGDNDAEKRIKRRFDAAATADDPAEFAYHLRGLIQLFKAKDLPLDYPALAQDLFSFQDLNTRDAVRLRWGRDFYYIGKDVSSETE
jgi:CRISPR system Cascade subunit CasB